MIQIIRFWPLLAAFLLINAGKSLAYDDPAFGKILFVIDGDTYQVSHAGAPKGEPVRARHFNTPEKGDLAECEFERIKAAQATEAARRLLPRGAVVRLANFGRDRYGRLLATITLADGRDLAAEMIGAGLAVPYEGGPRQSWCRPFLRRHDKAKGRSAPRARKGQAPAASGRRLGPGCPENLLRRSLRALRVSGATPPGPSPLALATPNPTTGKRFAGQRGIGPQGGLVRGKQIMAQYYTLVLLDRGTWRPEFGDYDKSVVEAERDDYHQGGGYPLRHLRIITTSDNQAAIDAAVAKLNEGGRSMTTPMTPGAAQAIAHHNHEADQAHRRAVQVLEDYNAAMARLQEAVARVNVQEAAQAEAEADAAWQELQSLLVMGYQHRNSAVIAASIAAEIENDRGEK